MIKKISIYLVSFFALLVVAFNLHCYTLVAYKTNLRLSLLEVYIFHCVISFVISIGFLLLSNSIKWSSQLGFIYVFTFITKLMLFVVAFKDSIFSIEKLTKTESLNLLIPVFLFLFLEVYFITKILNKK
ncbi:DUF6168 family protein [Lacinutrix jangbogonensis]|uniref:DUF6168 family protein n=1 Tax=Lacinutrix jangbogonensis TaxID=1469557 RepID=UPI00053F201E